MSDGNLEGEALGDVALFAGLEGPPARSEFATPTIWSAEQLGLAIKRCIDIVGALVLAIVFSPLILISCAILLASGGPVLFSHNRVGERGRNFRCYKFRSMVRDAEVVLEELLNRDAALKAEWEETHKLRNDPRITRIGAFLRRTSLDELPQLWNVLRGDMSLVGPRPVVRHELEKYGRYLHYYLSCRPGITGLWQVKGRSETDYRTRVALDVYYYANRSLFLDLKILLRTVGVVLFGKGAY